MEIRSYRPGDEFNIIDLWNKCMIYDPVTKEVFAKKVLIDPNFNPEGAKVVETDGEIVGFILTIARCVRWWDYSLDENKGWMTALFVHPSYRRQGLGAALVKEGCEYLKGVGRKEVYVSNYSPNYFCAGVDEKSYPGAMAFYCAMGFSVSEDVAGMAKDLHDFCIPEKILEKEKNIKEQGIEIKYLTWDLTFPTAQFFKKYFHNWAYFFHQKMASSCPLDEIVVTVLNGKEVLGYCQQLHGGHVGPFGMAPELRGKGIGSVMLYKLLDRMLKNGDKYAWFSLTEKAQNYYARAGFEITRQYKILKKEI